MFGHGGATRSLIGVPQFHAYFQQYNMRITAKQSPQSFRFGIGVHKWQGTFNARITLPNHSYINVKTIVPIDVLFLIRLDILLERSISINVHKHVIKGKENAWKLPTDDNSGHTFIVSSPSPIRCCFKRQELIKLCKHFMHPSTGNQFNLLKRATQVK